MSPRFGWENVRHRLQDQQFDRHVIQLCWQNLSHRLWESVHIFNTVPRADIVCFWNVTVSRTSNLFRLCRKKSASPCPGLREGISRCSCQSHAMNIHSKEYRFVHSPSCGVRNTWPQNTIIKTGLTKIFLLEKAKVWNVRISVQFYLAFTFFHLIYAKEATKI